jgi:ribosome-associated inhibitor A
MEKNVEYVHIPTSESLTNLINEKLVGVQNKYDWVIKADVFIKTENDKQGKGKVCEVRLSLPGPQVFASANAASFEAAVAGAIHAVEKQLGQRKAKLIHH